MKVQSNNNSLINAKITDAIGRTVELIKNVQANTIINFGQKYIAGTYFAEISQGTNSKTLKLLKINF